MMNDVQEWLTEQTPEGATIQVPALRVRATQGGVLRWAHPCEWRDRVCLTRLVGRAPLPGEKRGTVRVPTNEILFKAGDEKLVPAEIEFALWQHVCNHELCANHKGRCRDRSHANRWE